MRYPAWSILTALLCGAISVMTTQAAHAQTKCDQRPLPRVDATACAHAAQGADALRRFVTRTQAIYGLQMRDYVRFVDETPAAKAASTPPKESLAKAPPSSN